jgi:hypothetical protein
VGGNGGHRSHGVRPVHDLLLDRGARVRLDDRAGAALDPGDADRDRRPQGTLVGALCRELVRRDVQPLHRGVLPRGAVRVAALGPPRGTTGGGAGQSGSGDRLRSLGHRADHRPPSSSGSWRRSPSPA